jgi:hypothetical protein
MISTTDKLLSEARQALERVWFVQTLEVAERTDSTLALRLYISSTQFVPAFVGELTGSLYFALIEGQHRVFGIDQEGNERHRHPYHACHLHEPLPEGLEPKPLLRFLSMVESIVLDNDLL